MKNNTKHDRNFYSTFETETAITPHAAYTALGIDAALLYLNDELPNLSEEENSRLVSVAHVAASAALKLAQVPDDWLAMLAALHYDRTDKVRSELWEIVFNLLPDDDNLGARKDKAERRIMACARENAQEGARQAVRDLSEIYMGEVLESIYAAFALGFEIAHDPTRLITEKVGK